MSEGVGPVGEIRISDADREQVAGRLHTALAESRITLVELDDLVRRPHRLARRCSERE